MPYKCKGLEKSFCFQSEWSQLTGKATNETHGAASLQDRTNDVERQFSTRESISLNADSFTHCKLLWRDFQHIKHDGIVALRIVSARAVHRHGAVASLNMRKKQYEDTKMSTMKYYRCS